MSVQSEMLFYTVDPAGIFSTLIGGTAIWTGGSAPDGSATIFDSEAGVEGQTLDSGSAGLESAVAHVFTAGGTSGNAAVAADIVWTLRDTVTGETFQLVQFAVGSGGAAGLYTLSERPLVAGRSYETLGHELAPDVTAGAAAFSYLDYDHDAYAAYSVTAPSGSGTVDGTNSDDALATLVDAEGESVTAGADTIIAGGGQDSFNGASLGDDLWFGGSGNDLIFDEAGIDTIHGGAGDDTIGGEDGAFYGGDGNDSLQAPRFGVIDGGDGIDTLDTSGGSGAYAIDLTITGSQGYTAGLSGVILNVEDVRTGAGDDTLIGDAAANQLSSGDGDDVLQGNDGNDRLLGGAGDDILSGGADADTFVIGDGFGNDTISGGDTFTTDADSDTIDLSAVTNPVSVVFSAPGAGTITDIVTGEVITFSGIETLILTGQGDTVDATLDGNATSLFAGDGDDLIVGGAGDDRIEGGYGSDTILPGGGADLLLGLDGADTFVLAQGFGGTHVDGGADYDRIDLGGLSNGAEVVFTAPGAGRITDRVTGDVMTFENIQHLILTDQDDIVDATLDGGQTYIEMRNGADSLIGSTGNDIHDDEADGPDGQGNDTFLGGDGDDEIWAGTDDDSVSGGAGNDTLEGQSGNDTVEGGTGDDGLFGGIGDDSVLGGEGDDFIQEGSPGGTVVTAGDTVTGTAINDSFVFAGDPGTTATIILDDGTGTANDGDIQFDAVFVTSTGNGASLRIEGFGYGVDRIVVSQLWTGLSTTQIDAGQHRVTLTYANGNTQTFDILHDNGPVFDPALVMFTYAGNDTLDGGAGNDTIDGAYGDDLLSGGLGADSVFAGQGADVLYGGAGSDTLNGWTGADTIAGGAGDDLLTGGDGTDTFIYSAGDGLDVVTDFNFGNGGTLSDGDATNNDFVDLSSFYDHIAELHDDYADDGILNQSNGGNTVRGQVIDYADNARFDTDGTPGNEGIIFLGQSPDGASFTNENTGVICFTPGTLILTETGPRPVELLRRGDRIVTRDNGVQTLQWRAERRIGAAELRANESLRPVLIRPELIGAHAPLLVSPQHGILLRPGGGEETLVRAISLARCPGGKARVAEGKRQVTYIHLMFDAHQIVFANGAPTESFYPGPMALAALSGPARTQLQRVFPALFRGPADDVFGPRIRRVARARDLPPTLHELRAA